MKKKNFFLFLFLVLLTINGFTESFDELCMEYSELMSDLYHFGPNGNLPYYKTGSDYIKDYAEGYPHIDVDSPFAFAIIGPGFMKFEAAPGIFIYAKYVWLHERSDGNLYSSILGRCVDEIIPTEEEGVYKTTLYFPCEDAVIESRVSSLIIDKVYSEEGKIISGKINNSLINPVTTIIRMLQILAELKTLHPENVYHYSSKEQFLLIMLDYCLQGQLDAEKYYYENRRYINLTPEGYNNLHSYYSVVFTLLPAIKLEEED